VIFTLLSTYFTPNTPTKNETLTIQATYGTQMAPAAVGYYLTG
jgi:hypothetical protein